MLLDQYGEGLALEAAFWLQGLRDPEYPASQLGALAIDLSQRFRTLGILVLLVKGSSDGFYHHLIRSGRCRLTYLERLQAAGVVDDYHRASGRYQPLMDAVAAGDLRLAERIALASPAEWLGDREYQDDYCYAQVMHVMLGARPEDTLSVLLAQFGEALEGRPDARLSICEALAARDSAGFSAAFSDLLEERSLAIAEEKRRGRLEEPQVIAERHVFVEGLALLRIATLRGVATETEYLYCPSLARRRMRAPFPGE